MNDLFSNIGIAFRMNNSRTKLNIVTLNANTPIWFENKSLGVSAEALVTTPNNAVSLTQGDRGYA